jgi:hypothetical protein
MSAEPAKRRIVRWGALGIGVILFFVTLYYINFRLAVGTIRQLGIALPLVLVVSGLWHLVRTWAWAWCFPRPLKVSFLRLARVRRHRREPVPGTARAGAPGGGGFQLSDAARNRR